MTRASPTYSNVANNTAASWWLDPGLRRSMFHIFLCFTGLYTLGFDALLFNGLQAIQPWQQFFGRPKGVKLGLISASFYFPKVLLAFIVPTVSDRYGRKAPLYISVVFNIAGAIVGGTCRNTAQLVGARVLVGTGTSFGLIGSVTMVPELAHPRLRHQAGSFLWTTFYIGSIVAAWLTFGMTYYGASNYAWRVPMFLQGLGPAILAAGLWWMPQSPRWLIKQGREEEAHHLLAYYHANGKMDDELVLLELREIKASIEMEAIAKSGKWSDFITVKSMRTRLFIITLIGVSAQCCGNGIISYYLVPILRQVGITKPAQTAGINGGISIFSWLASMVGAYLVERVGRRKLFLTGFAGMFCTFVIVFGLSGSYATTRDRSTGIAVVPFLFLFQMFYGISMTPLPALYVPEITPLSMRVKAIGYLSFTQSWTGVFNQFVNSIALTDIGYRYYGVYVALLAIFFTLYYFFLKETRGLTVEESALVYEPKTVQQQMHDTADDVNIKADQVLDHESDKV